MKKQFFSLAAIVALAIGFTSCSNGGDETTSTDTSSTTNTTMGTSGSDTSMSATSTGSYAAMADSVERNSEQGYYLNPKTGQSYGKLKVDRSSGRVSTEAGEPVWRYVDRRNWWVYGYGDDDNWSQVGEAQMKGDMLQYKGDGDQWVDYNTRWSKDDEVKIKKYKVSDGGNKEKIVTEDGDKIKVKTDEDGDTKIKVNDEKIKMDKDGNIKKKD